MKTLKLKAASTLRGELVLSSISQTTVLTANGEITVSDKQFWADDIQRCLAKKVLTLIEGNADTQEGLVMIKLLRNIENLVLPSLPDPVRFGYIYEIPKKTFEKDDIQNAIRRRVIAEVTQAEYDAILSADKRVAASKTPVTGANPPSLGSDDFAARKLAEIQSRQGPRVEVKADQGEGSTSVAAIKPESIENIDLNTLSAAERFALTGQAQTFNRDVPVEKQWHVADPHKTQVQDKRVPSNFTVFDPRTANAPQVVTAGAPKRLIKRAGNAPGDGPTAEDGVEIDVT